MTEIERKSPPVRDSDLMYLAIRKLEAVAEKMARLEYDEKLDELLREADEWFDWAAYNINKREGKEVKITGLDLFNNLQPREQEKTITQFMGMLIEQGYKVIPPEEES